MTKETFEKARLYSLDKQKFGFLNDFFSIILSTVVIAYGILAVIWDYADSINMWEGEVAVSCIWTFLLSVASTVIHMPLTIYYTFVLEEKYGFNKQTAKFFMLDKLKGFILGLVLSLPTAAVTIVIVKYGGEFCYFLFIMYLTLNCCYCLPIFAFHCCILFSIATFFSIRIFFSNRR